MTFLAGAEGRAREHGGGGGGAHPQALFSSTSKSICNPSVISHALLISAFNRSGPYCGGSPAPRPWGQTVRNESDSEAWHPTEKGSAEAGTQFSSSDPWGIQTNPQVPVSWAVFLQLLLDQLPETRLPACPSPHPPGHRGSFIHCPPFPASPSPAAGRDPAGSLLTGLAFTSAPQAVRRGVVRGEGTGTL